MKKEIEAGDRFKFGANWLRSLRLLDEARIKLAEESLKDMLRVEDLSGKKVLGCGQWVWLI